MSYGSAPLRRYWAPNSPQSVLLLGLFTFVWMFLLATFIAQSALRAVVQPESGLAAGKRQAPAHRPGPALIGRAHPPGPSEPLDSPGATAPGLRDSGFEAMSSVARPSAGGADRAATTLARTRTRELNPSEQSHPTRPPHDETVRIEAAKPVPYVAAIPQPSMKQSPNTPDEAPMPPRAERAVPDPAEGAPRRDAVPMPKPAPARKVPVTPASTDIF